ncbi:MAG TPA: heme-binding protein [Tepidisphaeraceae bacterium]|jgi:uncharacterized protein GlcG (DUF336 family)|nr:heme-binding protein [Tepidisphaeraceae bacterium]
MASKSNRRSFLGLAALVIAAGCVAPLVAQQQGDDQAQPAALQQSGASNPNDITLDQAHAALEAAAKKAEEIKTKMDICVVDAGGNLKAFARMDGAWIGSIDISIKKAKTARFFDMNTGEIGKLSQPGGPLYGIEHSNGGLITFPGGVPIKNQQGTVIGAIGVSGSTVENDHAVAMAGAQAAPKGSKALSR